MAAAALATTATTATTTPSLLPPAPSAYTCALLSNVVYYDAKSDRDRETPAGWRCIKFKDRDSEGKDIGYRGGIWVNDATKQIVVAHQGSHTLYSWLEDLRSIVSGIRGAFTSAAIDLANDEALADPKYANYRVVHTGHSLGGFLAQCCVFFSKRRELKSTTELSAIVFDSPGAVEYFEDNLASNIRSETPAINIATLNIQNYCARPNIVNTFGAHTGTLWHLQQPNNMRFSFVSSHLLEDHIIPGFNRATGELNDWRQMTDWPSASYQSLFSATATAAKTVINTLLQTISFPFRVVRSAASAVTGITGGGAAAVAAGGGAGGGAAATATYTSPFALNDTEIAAFEKLATGDVSHRPALAGAEARITAALTAHYAHLDILASKGSLGAQHFDEPIRDFMWQWDKVQQHADPGLVGEVRTKFRETYGISDAEMQTLDAFNLKWDDNKATVALKEGARVPNIFVFQTQLQELLVRHERDGVLRFTALVSSCFVRMATYKRDLDFLAKRMTSTEESVEGEMAGINTEILRLRAELKKQKEELQALLKAPTSTFNATVEKLIAKNGGTATGFTFNTTPPGGTYTFKEGIAEGTGALVTAFVFNSSTVTAPPPAAARGGAGEPSTEL